MDYRITAAMAFGTTCRRTLASAALFGGSSLRLVAVAATALTVERDRLRESSLAVQRRR